MDQELKAGFLVEARELLEQVRSGLLAACARYGAPDPAALDAAQRAIHNVNGCAKAVGFADLATLAQETETLLIRLRSAEHRPEALTLLHRAHARLLEIVEGLTEDPQARFIVSPLLQELRSLIDSIPWEPEVRFTEEELGRLLAAETQNALDAMDGRVSLDALAEKLSVVAEETAKRVGRHVHFEIRHDPEVRVPSQVVSSLEDPLVHLIRNAIDHGIETDGERASLAKPSEGRVLIEALREGDRLVLLCSDDGRGIDREHALRKAREKGFPIEEGVDPVQLIFLPGFSTRDEVTDLSGRGIGMDIVRSNIESLGGQILVETRVGHGTTFRIEVPLAVSMESAA